MKPLLFFIFAFALTTYAEDSYPRMEAYSIVSDSLDPDLDSTGGVYEFYFSQRGLISETIEVLYAVDQGENTTATLGKNESLIIPSTPGNHAFAFYLNSSYREVEIADLPLQPGHRIVIQVNFNPVYEEQMVRKPVIYLYPEDTIGVSVDVLPKGDFTFTYPPIENGWNFTCAPDGSLYDESGSYPYLFWESRQEVSSAHINVEEGAVLEGSDVVAYLEKQLTAYGMTSAERTDFITYWGPILQTKSNLYIYLLFDEECDAFASLKINPTPASIGRFYVLWTEVPSNYSPALRPQTVPVFQRDGFSVLEWGGVQFNASLLIEDEL